MSQKPTSKQSPAPTRTATKRDTFDVTQVIGTVTLGEDGELSPDLAAYQIIHRHDMPGTYTFPNVYGADTTVTIGTPPEPDDAGADVPYSLS